MHEVAKICDLAYSLLLGDGRRRSSCSSDFAPRLFGLRLVACGSLCEYMVHHGFGFALPEAQNEIARRRRRAARARERRPLEGARSNALLYAAPAAMPLRAGAAH